MNELKLDIPISQKPISPLLKGKNYEFLGSGFQAIAYFSKKFPGKVIRASYIQGKNDPHYQFLRLCVNHKTNPYFPNVYTYKIYPSKELYSTKEEEEFVKRYMHELRPDYRPYVLIVVMEELKQIPHNLHIRKEIVKKFMMDPNVYHQDLDDAFIDRFDTKDSRKELIANTPDKYFAQALRLLEPLFNRYYEDVAFKNMMLRGNQLVFTDPFWN